MTIKETANALRRLAAAFDHVERKMPGADSPFGKIVPAFNEEQALGAATLLTFIRDLVTNSPRDSYPREDLLVLLETISRDGELFPNGAGLLAWQAEGDDE